MLKRAFSTLSNNQTSHDLIKKTPSIIAGALTAIIFAAGWRRGMIIDREKATTKNNTSSFTPQLKKK